jgi:hypothetical protein
MPNERRLTLFSFSSSILASIMAVCLAVVFGRLISLAESSWPMELFEIRGGMIVGVFLVALEVQWTRRLIEPRPLLTSGWWKAIGIEWGLLILGLLAMIWITEGPAFALRDLRSFSTWNFPEAIRAEHIEGFLLLLAVWGFSRFLAADLIPLENFSVSRPIEQIRETIRIQSLSGVSRFLAADLIPSENFSGSHPIEQIREIGRVQSLARNRLWQDVFSVGGFMALLSIFDVTAVRMVQNLPVELGPLGPETLVYFLCGFGLFTISHLLVLRVDWVMDRTRFDSGISRRWMVYSLGFILILLLLASALPTEYSFNLLTSLNLVILEVTRVLLTLWSLIVYIIAGIGVFLLSFLGKGSPVALDKPEQKVPTESIPALPAGATWSTAMKEILFWVLAALVLIYLLHQLLKFRLSILRRLRRWSITRWIYDWIEGWRKRLIVWGGGLARAMQDSMQALREDLTSRTGFDPLGFINLRRLNPRQSIRFYFFALLRRGGERGIARGPAQTPREYAAGLMGRDEPIKDELREMVLAFEEARYTAHDISPEQASRVRKIWDTIRTRMRFFKREAEPGGNRTP